MEYREYAAIIGAAISAVAENQSEKLDACSHMIKNVIENDGLIYIFGCGHSHILAEECFYRAGGLACVVPIFYEPLMLHESASKSSQLEKESGLATEVLSKYSFCKNDLLICISTSDKNAVPVELAYEVKKRGIPVIAVSSSNYFEDPVKNSLGLHLHEVCDIWIDNLAAHGDACMHLAGSEIAMAPTSTIVGSFLLNSILAKGAQSAIMDGVDVPIYLSGNVQGGAEHNKSLIERYSKRISCL